MDDSDDDHTDDDDTDDDTDDDHDDDDTDDDGTIGPATADKSSGRLTRDSRVVSLVIPEFPAFLIVKINFLK